MKNNKQLLEEIQNTLAKEKTLVGHLTNMYVLVNDGAVIIAGSVDTTPIKTLVRKIVKTVPGVTLLMEDLKVESHEPHRMGVQIDWANGRMALNPAS